MARPRKYDDSFREALINAAAARIANGDSLALRALAEDCGCTTSTIYSLFGDRDGLLEAVAAYVSDSFGASQNGVGQTPDPLDDLRRLGLAYRDWASRNPTLYQVMFSAPSTSDDDDCAGPIPDSPTIAPLVDAVRRAVEQGLLTSGGGVEAIVRSIWAGVHGWATLELTGRLRGDTDAYARHLDSLVHAWRA